MLSRTPGEQLKPELEFVAFPYHSGYHFSLIWATRVGSERNVCLSTLRRASPARRTTPRHKLREANRQSSGVRCSSGWSHARPYRPPGGAGCVTPVPGANPAVWRHRRQHRKCSNAPICYVSAGGGSFWFRWHRMLTGLFTLEKVQSLFFSIYEQ